MSGFRKVCRWIHREFGYLAAGMTIIYAISGVAVNHTHQFNPSYIEEAREFAIEPPGFGETDEIAPVIIERLSLTEPVKNVWRATPGMIRVIIESGTYDVELATGQVRAVQLRPRPVLNDVNFLHLNKPKGLWTWVADVYAVLLGLLALTGLFLVKGRRGLTGRGGVLLTVGLALPLAYLIFEKYL